MGLKIALACLLGVAVIQGGGVRALEMPWGAHNKQYYEPECRPQPTGNRRFKFNAGRLYGRQCQLDMLRTGLASETLTYLEVAQRTQEIRWYYNARSGRQQTWLDSASTATAVGSFGFLASQGAPTLTQSYWGALALAPVLGAQFNAYEPTRDLFYGGAVGMDLISKRYEQLYWSARNLNNLQDADGLNVNATTHCNAVRNELDRVAGKVTSPSWDGDAEDRKALLPDLQAALKACERLDLRRAYLNALGKAVEVYVAPVAATSSTSCRSLSDAYAEKRKAEFEIVKASQNPPAANELTRLNTAIGATEAARLAFERACSTQLSYLYARDVLAFDATMEHSDHDLRYGPAETLSAMAASPFQLVSTLLTGEDGKKAVAGLKTQAAFNSLDLKLSSLVLPPPPPVVDTAQAGVSSTARARLGAVGQTQNAEKSVRQTLEVLDKVHLAVNDGAYALSTREAWAALLRQAVAADRLTFSYDATKSAVSVSVGPAPPVTAPLATVGNE